MAFQLSLRPQTLTKLRRIRPLSSSTLPDSSPDTSSAAIPDTSSAAAAAAPPPPPPPSFASPFGDIKDRLRSPPPRRIRDLPLPPPRPTGAPAPASYLADIRKHLAEFRNSSRSPSSSPPTLSFQDLYKKNHLDKPSAAAADDDPKRIAHSFDSIRESLRKLPGVQTRKPSFRGRDSLASGFTPPIKPDELPSSIFGKEKSTDDAKPTAPKTEFWRTYSYKELGEKLRRLRPEVGDNRFSIAELNDRLVKLHELEEKETDSRMGMGSTTFRDLRQSLYRIKEADLNKKAASRDRLSILTNITGLPTPAFMLKPPQEELLEKFNHPDHMSAAEKMKLELQKVRDEFKMSESDCGSTRVQVALLTTKIKHLSSVLHKKDKHSRKGLNEMVQKRKKLLKYLRRTDWDSYCFTLSKLGLRDSPQYKASNYKIKA